MKHYWKLILSMLIWGTLPLVVRPVTLPSAQIVVYCIGFGFLFLAIAFAIRRKPIDRRALCRALPRLLLSGAAMGGNWVALFEAYRFVDVSIATLAYYCAPIIVIVISAFIYREGMSFKKLLCIAASLVGVVLVTQTAMGGSDPLRGVLCGLLSAALYATVTLINKSVSGVDDMASTLLQLLGAGLVVLPYALLTSPLPWTNPSSSQWLCLVVLGLVHTGLALTLYFSAVRVLPAQACALCSYIDPVSALVFAAVFLGETMSIVQVLGAVFIIGGAAFGSVLCSAKPSVD